MTAVVVVGCGIAGPVLAILLHDRGYKPVIVERVKQINDVGLGLGLFPNGMKVLSAAGLEPVGIPMLQGAEYSSDGEYLGTRDQTYFKEKYGQSACGVRRSDLSHVLRDELARRAVPIHLGWELHHIHETDGEVTATAKDGRQISAAFLVGCDGLHSATRNWVLARHGQPELPADSTGLVMVGGFSPTPETFKEGHPCTFYGEARFALTYKVDSTTSVWGVVLSAPDENESWLEENDAAKETAVLLKEMAAWPEIMRTMISTTTRLVKFGLYDRPELPPEQWYHGRCVLLGDAAHPTTPHQGQGANQALEDCWHLSQMLPEAMMSSTAEELTSVFRRYAEKRQPRTAMLVKSARAQGNMRVVRGAEACRQRNAAIKQMWLEPGPFKALLHDVLKEPF